MVSCLCQNDIVLLKASKRSTLNPTETCMLCDKSYSCSHSTTPNPEDPLRDSCKESSFQAQQWFTRMTRPWWRKRARAHKESSFGIPRKGQVQLGRKILSCIRLGIVKTTKAPGLAYLVPRGLGDRGDLEKGLVGSVLGRTGAARPLVQPPGVCYGNTSRHGVLTNQSKVLFQVFRK